MAKWEVCKIVYQESILMRGKWVARMETSKGQQIIDQSEEFGALTRGEESCSKLVARLLENGWEPIQVDKEGGVSAFKRQVP
jgi:hypothetical protein